MWNLRISEEEFDIIYSGINVDKERFRVDISKVSEEDEFAYLSKSKLWRLNHWYTIVDKDGFKIPFKMNLAQHKAFAKQLKHPRSIILKSRQRGISTFFLINYFDDALTLPNLTIGMQSYGLEESTALLEKLTVAWLSLNDYIKTRLLSLELVKNNTKLMSFSNGSQVKVATSFRGTTLHRLHVSELGKIANKDPKKAKELQTGTLQAIKAGNPVAIESTAEGQHNAFHEWWYKAVDLVGNRAEKDFDPVFLSWVDDSDCQSLVAQELTDVDKADLVKIELEWSEYSNIANFKLDNKQKWWFVAAKRELGDKFAQEYPHTPEAAFASVRDGTYYARQWREEGNEYKPFSTNKREYLFDPDLQVHTAWDLGVNDMMVIIFFQIFGKEIRLINEYHNTGEGLEHYVKVLHKYKNIYKYNYDKTILPHDGNVFEMGASMTRKSRLYELGLRKIRVLKRTKDVNTDIEQVRKAIPNIWIDKNKCSYIIKALTRYSKKWDDSLGTFKDKPLHDEWSNPADTLRYIIMSRTKSTSDNSTTRRRSNKTNIVDGIAL